MKTATLNSKKMMSIVKVTATFAMMVFSWTVQAQNRPQVILPKKHASYFGYEVSLTGKTYAIESDIEPINSLRVTQMGTNVGIVMANQIGKIRVNAGLSFSDGNTPYTINTYEGSVSGNLYLLRLKQIKSHAIEPYVVASFGYQLSQFYGTYLKDFAMQNASVTQQPLLGEVSWLRPSAGAGVEWQLANESQHFIHLFAEARYGTSFWYSTSNKSFDQTRVIQPLRLNVGISFGLSRI